MATIIKNGKTYDSGDAKITINGVLFDLAEIVYGNEQEHQLGYSLGSNDPTHWSIGKKTPNASMSVAMHNITPLEKTANGSLLSLRPFEINVTFVNDYNAIVNDTITAKFMTEGREVTGDMGLQMQYPLFALNVGLNNV